MHKILLLLMIIILNTNLALAFRVYHYNQEGERVYRTITEEDIKRNKKVPRRTFIRLPKKPNWEITDEMRARKKTTSDFTHRK